MAELVATEQIFPIVVVHAVTAAGLHDEYPLDHERCWSPLELLFHQYDRIALYPSVGVRPEDPRYEAQEPALVRPREMFGLIYKDLFAELRHNLSYDGVPAQPVYPFVYDWRQDNLRTSQLLREFIEEVIARTNLMRHDPKALARSVGEGRPLCEGVDLVGHSMGGLVIAGCIAGNEAWAKRRVRRVVTLGTPYRGANAAITKLATGGGTLFGRGSRERERTAARVTPSVYQLLPSFETALKDHAPEAIWDPETFQPSIRRTLAEFVAQVHADLEYTKGTKASREKCQQLADQLFAELLGRGREFRRLTDRVSPRMLRPDGQWLAIVGAGEKTLVSTGFTSSPTGDRWFDFDPYYCSDDWDGSTLETGDETVPLRAAIPPWKDSWRNTVVVTRHDFATLGEFGDGILRSQLGLHSVLPLLNLAQRWIINFFRPEWVKSSKLGQHGRLWGRPLPGHSLHDAKNAWRELIHAKLRIEDP